MQRGSGSGSRMTGIPSLIAFARVTRIQKAEMEPKARMNMAVSTYSLLRAKYKGDKGVAEIIMELGEDIKNCRKQFEVFLADGIISPDEDSLMTQILDGIEYRIDDVIVMTRAIDTATLEEMVVPD